LPCSEQYRKALALARRARWFSGEANWRQRGMPMLLRLILLHYLIFFSQRQQYFLVFAAAADAS
jgi:hypothetical protein